MSDGTGSLAMMKDYGNADRSVMLRDAVKSGKKERQQ
jgi:hypothetical protein